jgi:hypothetical protein
MTDAVQTIDAVEQSLRPPATNMAPYPAKHIELSTGEKLVIREVSRADVPLLLELVRPLVTVPTDKYDIVAARTYAELLGWATYRVKDEFCLVGTIGEEIVGLVNSRMATDDIGISLHTLVIRQGGRIGANLFAAKMEHHFDFLEQKEVWAVAESPNGSRLLARYGMDFRPSQWHELGGGPTFVLTRENWERQKAQKCLGLRPVPAELLDKAKKMVLPSTYPQIPGYRR